MRYFTLTAKYLGPYSIVVLMLDAKLLSTCLISFINSLFAETMRG